MGALGAARCELGRRVRTHRDLGRPAERLARSHRRRRQALPDRLRGSAAVVARARRRRRARPATPERTLGRAAEPVPQHARLGALLQTHARTASARRRRHGPDYPRRGQKRLAGYALLCLRVPHAAAPRTRRRGAARLAPHPRSPAGAGVLLAQRLGCIRLCRSARARPRHAAATRCRVHPHQLTSGSRPADATSIWRPTLQRGRRGDDERTRPRSS